MENKFEVSSFKRKLMEYLIPEEMESGSLEKEGSVSAVPEDEQAGFMEMIKFEMKATDEQRAQLKKMLDAGMTVDKIKEFIKSVVGGFGTPYKQ